MCGVVAVFRTADARASAERALGTLQNRGPDASGVWVDDSHGLAVAHARLSIIDLSDAGQQPMTSADGRFVVVFNGELYNYVELRAELIDYPYRSRSDTEVLLAAWDRWGPACLDRFLGMFAFVIWDRIESTLYAVRDRFGVKPLYVGHLAGGGLALASEIKALHAAGVPRVHDDDAWAAFLAHGVTDQGTGTMWQGVEAIAAGTVMRVARDGTSHTRRWYDLAERVGDEDDRRDLDVVREEYTALLRDSVRLRFRSDVPVGINLSGGIDSSLLLGLVHEVQGADSDVMAFTFTTGDPDYDELPWVRAMLERTCHPLVEARLSPSEVPELAAQITRAQDEPFGGIPTLAYARLFAKARESGVIVLLDGQGLDEQWAGYDYYRSAGTINAPTVQGARSSAMRPECLSPEFIARATAPRVASPFTDPLRNVQLRDATLSKIPRALRYNDRVSMAASTELREPFLDHRLFELAMRQPRDRKIQGETGKWLLREIATPFVPERLRLAPKRPVQTPQREWLRGPLREWADGLIENALTSRAEWFDTRMARDAWRAFQTGEGDNSYWVWQWLSLGLLRA